MYYFEKITITYPITINFIYFLFIFFFLDFRNTMHISFVVIFLMNGNYFYYFALLFRFPTLQLFDEHQRAARHGDLHICNICNRRFASYSALNGHQVTHTAAHNGQYKNIYTFSVCFLLSFTQCLT